MIRDERKNCAAAMAYFYIPGISRIISVSCFSVPAVYHQFHVSDYALRVLGYILEYSGRIRGPVFSGHACFLGLGAYTTGILFQHFNCSPWLGLLASGLVAGLVALLIGIPCFRLSGSYFTLSTIALCNVIRIIFSTNRTLFGVETGAASGMKLSWRGGFIDMQFLDKRGFYYVILALLILALVVSYAISRSKMGYYLAAVRTNQNAAGILRGKCYGHENARHVYQCVPHSYGRRNLRHVSAVY